MSEPISDDELANLRSFYQAHPEYSHWAELMLITRLDAAESKLAAAEAERDATQEALLESERRRAEMHDFTAVELFDEAKRAQGEAHTAKTALQRAEAVIEAALKLHERKMKVHRMKGPNEWWCGHCHNDWPCPTVHALAAYDRALSTTPEEPE